MLSSVHNTRPSFHPCTRASSVSGPVVRIVRGSAAPAVSGPVVSSAARALSYAEVASVACKSGNGLHACTSNSGGSGGLLLVQESTSYNLDGPVAGQSSVRRPGPGSRMSVEGAVTLSVLRVKIMHSLAQR